LTTQLINCERLGALLLKFTDRQTDRETDRTEGETDRQTAGCSVNNWPVLWNGQLKPAFQTWSTSIHFWSLQIQN